MTFVHGTYFDGDFLRPHQATLEFSSDGQVTLRTETRTEIFAVAKLDISDRLGNVPRFLRLPDGGTVETLDNDGVDAALLAARRRQGTAWIHRLEAHSAIAAIATMLLVLIVAGSLHFGLPELARRTAEQVPVELETKAGEAALASINHLFRRSDLSRAERARVTRQLERLAASRSFRMTPRVEFRSLGGAHANAFALPGGIIVVSDELVKLTEVDEEIAAVLAHEIGHVELRHGMQSLLRSSFALLIVTSLTGDLSTLTTFAGSLPFVLLQNGYTREFEREADSYARDLLTTQGINPGHLASILRKLEAVTASQGAKLNYFNTHPGTDERVRAIDPEGHHPALPRRALASPEATIAVTAKPSATPLPPEVVAMRSVYSFPALDTEPVVIHGPPPADPGTPPLGNLESQVIVDFVVDRGGDVRLPYIVNRTAHPAYQASVLRTIETWKFSPGIAQGEPANAQLRLTFVFKPEDKVPQTPGS